MKKPFILFVASIALCTTHRTATAITPYQVYKDVQFESALSDAVIFNVPSNETFVLEHISGTLRTDSESIEPNSVLASMLTQAPPGETPFNVLFPHWNLDYSTGPSRVQSYYYIDTDTRAYYSSPFWLTYTLGLRDTSEVKFSVIGYLVPTLAADFNANGAVDAADYVAYRHSLGATGTGLFADGDNNGTVDPGDYDLWRSNFGESGASSGSSVSATVPEPNAALVLLLGSVLTAILRKRR